jgi:GGDEF domain-containing protein
MSHDEEAGAPERSALRLVGAVVGVIVCAYLIVDPLLPDINGNATVDRLVEAATLALCTAFALWFVVLAPLRGDTARERASTQRRERQLQDEAERQEFDGRVHRAMEMAGTEAVAYVAVGRALERGTTRLSSELLLADSSDSHLKRAAHAAPDGVASGCPVTSPRDCPAIRRSQTLVFPSGDEIDACPHLAGRPEGDRSAACVPVSVGGRSIGVLHATANPADPPTELEVSRLEALATQAGARLGMLRVMEATHLQAATDPLTGLLNRRSFENRVQELIRRRKPFTLAMGDLDHFKVLNDTHGHDAGDRALRLFSRTLHDAVRSEDLVCRYGGEEFVIAFPGLSVERGHGRARPRAGTPDPGARRWERASVHGKFRSGGRRRGGLAGGPLPGRRRRAVPGEAGGAQPRGRGPRSGSACDGRPRGLTAGD